MPTHKISSLANYCGSGIMTCCKPFLKIYTHRCLVDYQIYHSEQDCKRIYMTVNPSNISLESHVSHTKIRSYTKLYRDLSGNKYNSVSFIFEFTKYTFSSIRNCVVSNVSKCYRIIMYTAGNFPLFFKHHTDS